VSLYFPPLPRKKDEEPVLPIDTNFLQKWLAAQTIAFSKIRDFPSSFSDLTVGLADGTETSPSLRFTSDSDTGLYRVSANILGIHAKLFASVDSTPPVEIFPKGTLITMTTVNSSTDITNVPAAETDLSATQTTVACDYASQPIYVEMTVSVVWKGLTAGSVVGIRPGIAGAARGLQAIFDAGATDTDATAGGTGNTGGSSAANTGTTDPSATTTIDSGHNHSVLGDSHLHTITHTHTGPSHTHSHSHNVIPNFIPISQHFRIATTANGSGNVVLSIFGDGDATATADIDSWQMSYAIWRQ
jgi:hypothetical protein